MAKWSLHGQLALAVAALVLAGVSLMSSTTARSATPGATVVGGALLSTPVIAVGVLLVAGAVLGLVALRRPRLYSRAAIVQLAPLVLAVATSLSAPPDEGDTGSQVLSTYDVGPSIQETLRLLEWSSWLVFVAVLIAASSALLLLRLRRNQVPASRRGA